MHNTMQEMKSHTSVALAGAACFFFALHAGCVLEDDIDPADDLGGEIWVEDDDPDASDDPTADMDGEELWDEGPLAADVASDEVESVEADALFAAAPRFQLPFPCGQVWAGQTRTNHSPLASVDFNRAGDYGDTVVAAAAGTVTRVGNTGNTSYGRWIEISHGNGYTTRYAHLSQQRVSVGQFVRKGRRIGNVGNSGGSTGAHLHYEQRHNGVAVRARFNGEQARYYGTRNYKSRNSCGGGGHPGTINTSGAPLNVRSGPGTGHSIVGSVADGTHVTIRCQKRGQRINGTYGSTRLWDKIGAGYVSDAYVYTGSDGRVAPDCP